MTKRFFSTGAALLIFATTSFANGEYQRTRDGKTTIWNNEPKPGDQATWSGGRDGEGYAKGFGTLTWYSTPASSGGRAAESSPSKPELFARYFGRMERGKFSGAVNVHAKRQTRYAIFADGERVTRWAAGPAPYRASADKAALAAKKKREPEAPAEGPPAAKPENRTAAKTRSTTEEKPKRAVASAKSGALPNEPEQRRDETPAPEKSAKEIDPSLQLLAGPPSSLRHELPPPAAGPNEPSLSANDVVDAADAAVRTHGHDPGEFVRGEPKFDAQSGTWTLPYDRNNSADENAKGFMVTVDDATKGTVFVPAK